MEGWNEEEKERGREGGRKEGSKGEKEGEAVITVFMISLNLDTPTHNHTNKHYSKRSGSTAV